MRINNVAILAGGQGTRLVQRSNGLPKPMVPICGQPVLQHQIELCRRHGFEDILLLVQHRNEAISDYFGDGSRFGVHIQYRIESVPRGTFGALADALDLLASEFLVLYGDTYLDVDLRAFFGAHSDSGASATLFVHPNDHPYDSDLVSLDEKGFVQAIYNYPHPNELNARNLVNAGLYCISKDRLASFKNPADKSDIAKHLFPAMVAAGHLLRGYVSVEYIKDMGTPERLDKVERDIVIGVPERLSNRESRAAVFLDRDGTLNLEVNHLRYPEQVELLPEVGAAVRELNQAGILAVAVTNQPVVARGDVTLQGLDRIHGRLDFLLGSTGAYLDALYFCPHHPDGGFEGEVAELKLRCECRKPATGLIDRAARDLGICRSGAWMVGDSTSDIEAARRAGLRSILLRTGHAGLDGRFPAVPNYTASNLLEAVRWITEGHSNARRVLAPVALRAVDACRVVIIGGLARTGKSSAAQVLKELFSVYGRKAHVISLDGWLKPQARRNPSDGVLDRYDLSNAHTELAKLANAKGRIEFWEPIYDRSMRAFLAHMQRHSIGPDDILLIEGVPALHLPLVASVDRTFRLYLQVHEDTRQRRLKSDYLW